MLRSTTKRALTLLSLWYRRLHLAKGRAVGKSNRGAMWLSQKPTGGRPIDQGRFTGAGAKSQHDGKGLPSRGNVKT